MSDPYIVAVSGPTSAGKTFFCNKLLENCEDYNITSTRINTDNFYKDLSHLSMEERENINYDDPNAIDHEEFKRVIVSLSKGRTIEIPQYDMQTHTRTGGKKTIQSTNDLILIEGIFSLSFKEINDIIDLKIYVDLPSDLRLIRRLKRDTNKRGRSVDSVLRQYTNTVRPTQKQYVEKDRKKADFIIFGDQDHTKVIDLLLSYTLLRSSEGNISI